MHRWFRFCAFFALMNASLTAIPGGICRANEPNNNVPLAEDMPTPGKHQLRPTPLQIAQHRIERLAKKLEEQKAEIASLKQAAESHAEKSARKIAELEEKLAASHGHVATLEGQLNELKERFEKLIAAAPRALPAHAAPAEKKAPEAVPEPPPSIEGHDGPVHVVKKGDNLISIARKYGTTAAAIMEKNKIKDERKLQIGQTLAIPAPPKAEN